MANSSSAELLSRKEAARYLGITPDTLANWHSRGRYHVPVVKVGKLAKYRRSDLEAWLASRTESRSKSASVAPEAK